MSTRGVVAFIKDSKLTAIYNGDSSYPSCLGNDVLDFIRRYGIEEINKLVDSFVYTHKEEEGCQFYDLENFWRENKSKTIVYNDMVFICNSLHCEWVYIIDLDEEKLEVYKGFREEKPIGRFSNVPKYDNGFYAVSLVNTIDLRDLPAEIDKL